MDLSEKLTANLSWRYELAPLNSQFTGLKYLSFLFEGSNTVSLIQLEAEIELWTV